VKYVLLVVETEQFTSDVAAMSPSERQRTYDRDFAVAGPAAMNAGAYHLLKRGYR
jgi:hypothetical protein